MSAPSTSTHRPVGVPAHLPDRLTVCLWDFSWYVLAGPGEPYADLDAALDETAARGYTTVRICAAPLLLHGDLGLDDLADELPVDGMGPRPDGARFGAGTRWYAVPGGHRVRLRDRFFALLRGLHRRGMSVVLAGWEYQQSPALCADERWFRAIDAIPTADRPAALAAALTRMLDEIAAAGLAEVVALVELHNEVDFSALPALDDPATTTAIAALRAAHPGHLVTASLGKPPHLAMHTLPAVLGAGQLHVYAYGVLDRLQQLLDIRGTATADFPNALLRSLQRPGSPTWPDYGRPVSWKLAATVVTDQMLYGYDTLDPDAWDAWLYRYYGTFHEAMQREITARVTAVAAWGRWREVPVVIGEGWVGYTPLGGWFEEGPIGRRLAETGIRAAAREGIWGITPCSNAAPHHPMWREAGWQRAVNEEFRRA
ncbi:MAG TPA: cellulase-like family protein [Cellulomonas sp.]